MCVPQIEVRVDVARVDAHRALPQFHGTQRQTGGSVSDRRIAVVLGAVRHELHGPVQVRKGGSGRPVQIECGAEIEVCVGVVLPQ